jgi:hypothetical protein
LILEILLLVLLVAYFSIFTGLALIKGRKYWASYSQKKDNKDDLLQSQNSLTLSGLAVAAIALIVSLKFEGTLSSLAGFSAIILFFSISFVTLALSWNLIRFPEEICRFESDVLSDVGVLSIGCGFLFFFYSSFPFFSLPFLPVSITYGIFIVFFLCFACIDFRRYKRLWSLSEKETSENKKKKP